MGQVLVRVFSDDPAFKLVGSFGRASATADGLVTAEEALKAAEVVVDFTSGKAAAALAEVCAARGGPRLVIGATGFEAEDLSQIAEAAKRVAIVRAGNFSLGVNMLLGLVARAAEALPKETWDIEVNEAHHRHKVDAPSGTALMLGEAAARGRGVALASVARTARDGLDCPRGPDEIGFSVIRAGGLVGDHSVMFAAEDEILTITHSARDRRMFARGAAAAARWLVAQPPGEYDMQDVLGLSERSRPAGK